MAFPEKGALKEGRTIVVCDQSGFYLLPMVGGSHLRPGRGPR
jgi:hypothetical protein